MARSHDIIDSGIAPLLLVAMCVLGCGGSAGSLDYDATERRLPGEPITLEGTFSSARSISGSIASIAGIPIIAGRADVSSAETAQVASGGFSLQMTPLPGAEYIIAAIQSGGGAGVNASAGLIQLPAGGSLSYAGWPLDASLSATLSLGTVSPGEGGFLPSADGTALANALGLDQARLFREVQRDGYLREAQNAYFNRGSQLVVVPFHFIKARLENAYGKWSTMDDIMGPGWYSQDIMVQWRPETAFTVDDVAAGAVKVELIPPQDISVSGISVPAGTALVAGGGILNRYVDHYFVVAKGPPARGAWTVRIDGTVDGTWDEGLNTPYDGLGRFRYFVPSVKLSTRFDAAAGADALAGIELRWFAWNAASASYEELAGIVEDLPLAGRVTFQLATTAPDGADTRIDLPARVGEAQVPHETVYIERVEGSYLLNWVTVQYNLGSGFSFDFLSPGVAASNDPAY